MFYDQSIPVLTAKVKKGIFDFPSPWWDNISPSAIDLIKQCLIVDPRKRYNIYQFLNHPWMKVRFFFWLFVLELVLLFFS